MDLGRPLFSVLGFGFTFWGFGCVPFSSQRHVDHAMGLPRIICHQGLYSSAKLSATLQLQCSSKCSQGSNFGPGPSGKIRGRIFLGTGVEFWLFRSWRHMPTAECRRFLL